MMDTDENQQVLDRAEALKQLITEAITKLGDAKTFEIEASYEFVESASYNQDDELCPRIRIIKRVQTNG